MKLSHAIIIFCIFAFALMPIHFFRINRTSLADKADEQYTNMLISACYDTMQQTIPNDEGYIFETAGKRAAALEHLYSSLELTFNTRGSEDMNNLMKLRLPVVCLIDIDGFYLSYYDVHKDNTGAELLQMVELPLQSWSLQKGSYVCQFRLDDNITVIDRNTGAIVSGNREMLYEYTGLDIFKTQEDYEDAKYSVIVNLVNENIEYYINEYNISSPKELQYTFTMSTVRGEDWAKMMNHPSIIAFLQGIDLSDGSKTINLYSIAGGEVKSTENDNSYYTIEKTEDSIIYHTGSCPRIISDAIRTHSLDRYIKQGAVPCPFCH